MWQIPVALKVITAHMVVPAMLKKLTARPSRTRQISLQFGICALLSSILFLTGTPGIDQSFLLIFGIGVINCFACYAQWRAVDINLSKTALFTQADDLIALSLGYLFLGETKFLSSHGILIGIALCFCGATVFSLSRKSEKQQDGIRLMIWIGIYSVVWGVATFAIRCFAIGGVSIGKFTFAWYAGSFLGSFLLIKAAGKTEKGAKLSKEAVRNVAVFSIFIWSSMLLAYQAFKMAPITVVQPIFQVTEMVFPAIIGLWFFREAKNLGLKEKLIFAVGLTGTMILFTAF